MLIIARTTGVQIVVMRLQTGLLEQPSLLLYRENMYMNSNVTNDVVSHDYKLTVFFINVFSNTVLLLQYFE